MGGPFDRKRSGPGRATHLCTSLFHSKINAKHLETSIGMADAAVHNEPQADLRAETQATDAQDLQDESEEQHHKSQNDSNATQPERAEDLALQIASGKVSKKSFFERFTVLWAQRKMIDKLKTSPHVKRATEFVGSGTNKLRERLISQQYIDKKKEKMNMPPFVRTIDKLGFMMGILLMLVTEALLTKPNAMYQFYTVLMFPLMVFRFASYHRMKWHYFMLDFCYYCQILLLFFIYWHSSHPIYFQFVFCLSNGPLAGAIVMWKNSLVFHDIDKMISLFIHIYPPIVTYCLRWWHSDSFVVCRDAECSISWTASFWMPLMLYSFWQALYIFKTELMDKKKLDSDANIMTSLRWFIREDKPHPIYKALLVNGIRIKPLVLLVIIQFTYTILTLIPMHFAYQNFYVHSALLFFVFCACTWYGATFYFEVFSESYSKRLSTRLKSGTTEAKEKEKTKKGLPTKNSFLSFCSFFVPALTILYFLIERALAFAT